MSGALVQTLLVALLVLGAAAYLGRRAWRSVAAARRPAGGAACGSGCGCGTDEADVAAAGSEARGGRPARF